MMAVTAEMMDVLYLIPKGKENAVSRAALCAAAGYSDRLTRRIIAQLRDEGYIIINDQNGKGYYLSDDLDEIEKQYKQDTARAMAILKRRKYMRKMLKEAGRPV